MDKHILTDFIAARRTTLGSLAPQHHGAVTNKPLRVRDAATRTSGAQAFC